MNELISVIIPVYNSERFIKRCINSVLNQTYKNYEIILVNDGSTDSSLDIIENFAKHNSCIRIINMEHAGVSAARNVGLREAKGQYIQFIDSDDYIEAVMLERLLYKLKMYDADVAICDFEHPCIRTYAGDALFDMSNSKNRLRLIQTTFTLVVPWSKLWKREAITDYYDEDVSFTEDELFVLSNINNARKVICVSDVLYHYYCAPPDSPLNEQSCITKLAKAEDFWKTKKTFWYMRCTLMPKVADILKKHYSPEEFEDVQYSRAFDFMLWELIILYYNGADKNGLIYEMQSIMNDERFKHSVQIKHKYGIKLRTYKADEYNANIIYFVKEFMSAYQEIMDKQLKERPFYICLALFIMHFIDTTGPLDDNDIIARVLGEMNNNTLPEMNYIRDKFKLKKSTLFTLNSF